MIPVWWVVGVLVGVGVRESVYPVRYVFHRLRHWVRGPGRHTWG